MAAGDWLILEYHSILAHHYAALRVVEDGLALQFVELPHPAGKVREREGKLTDHDRRLAYREELLRSLLEAMSSGDVSTLGRADLTAQAREVVLQETDRK